MKVRKPWRAMIGDVTSACCKFFNILIVILAIYLPFSLIGSNFDEDLHNVEIHVTDSRGYSLTGVVAEIIGSDQKAVSDIDGIIKFKLESGFHYTVRLRYLGFESLEKKITIRQKSNTRFKLRMTESSTELSELTIVGESSEEALRKIPYKTETVNLSNIRSEPTPVVNVLGQLPGMRIRQNGGVGSEIDISINGIGGKGVKVFVDEIPVYLLGAGYSINNISPSIIENIEVYKGTIPVKFGSDALGGVINIKTRRKSADYLDLSYSYGSWNTHQTSVSANKRFGKNRQFNVGVEGFQTYSDNSYWMEDVEILDEELSRPGLPIAKRGRARRFNDTFDAKLGRVSIGARQLKWADEIQFFGSLSDVYREYQHGITSEDPWGDAFSEEESWSTAFTWKKFDKHERWGFTVSAGMIQNQSSFVDTTSKDYKWDASFVVRPFLAGESGLFGNGTTPVIHTDTYFARQSSNFAFSQQHSLNLTSLYTVDALTATNPALSQDNQDGLSEPQDLVKDYLGLAWESKLLKSRLHNTLSVKHYYQQSKAISVDQLGDIGALEDNSYSLLGYGDVVRFHASEAFVANLGYEYTIRQPDGEELFGNFITIIPNPDLSPEKSQNFNAGGEWTSKNRNVRIGGAFFYRNTTDKIFLVAGGNGRSQYQKLSEVEATGFELNADYKPVTDLKISLNGTYQDVIAKGLDLESGFSPNSIGEKIPNVPYFFYNIISDYAISKLPFGQGKLRTRYSFNYVHSFLATWNQDAKGQASTPDQTIHNLSAVWVAPENKWSLGVECRNLFDALAFDNFEVQKPGRSVYVKARFYLEKL